MNAAKIRIATGLVAGIAILTLTACNSSQDSASTTAPTAPITSSSTTQPQAPAQVADPGTKAQEQKPAKPAANVLGPRGFGKATMGMTYAEAKAAGVVRDPQDLTAPCLPYPLYVDGKRNGWVYISADRGIEAIGPDNHVRTPEGVAVGWSVNKVKKVYPDLNMEYTKVYNRETVAVPGSAKSLYRLVISKGVVTNLGLQLSDQKCYE